MPSIRMKRDAPHRFAGKLYNVDMPEAWELVRDGLADWEYVPEKKMEELASEETAKAPPRKK